MKAIPIILSVVVLAVVGAVVVDSLGGADSSSAGNVGFNLGPPREEGLHPGSVGGASISASRKSSPKVVYTNSRYYKLGPQAMSTFHMQCPKGTKAIDGYFYANKPGVALGSSFPAKRAKVASSKKPRWNFGVLNFNTTATAKYYTGVTCMKGVRG